jgi:hypothetical protein
MQHTYPWWAIGKEEDMFAYHFPITNCPNKKRQTNFFVGLALQ